MRMAGTPDDWVAIGKVGSPHGVAGEIKLVPLSDVPDRFRNLKNVYWFGPQGKSKRLMVARIRSVKTGYVVLFKEYSDPESVRELTGGTLSLPMTERGQLPKDHYFIDDLMGLAVEDEHGNFLGTVSQILQTNSNDIYEIKSQQTEWLLPALKQTVLKIDLQAKRMIVKVPESI